MATDIIPLITPSADRLCDIVSGQLQYVIRYENYYSKLEKGMVQLRAKKEDVDRKLEKARRELKEPTKSVLEWLKSFETVENEWMTLREKRDTSSRCMNGFLPNPLSRHKMSKIILKMAPDVNDLYRNGDFTEVADDPQPRDVVPQVTSGNVNSIESRERIMNDMIEYLKDDSIRSIGVHGMGGIGKTTLVKNINDELLVKQHFKKVIMVTVSKDPDVKKIQEIIAERLGLELKEIDLATRADKLYERLKLEDSVLIILDDMWNMMELGELGLSRGTRDINCKFIITTRNVDVCKQMKVLKTIEMGLLSEIESWVLFEEKAGPTFGLSEFQSIAQEIVRKCKGSPLAIATLGSTLGGEDKEFVWKNALSVLQNPSAMGLKGIMPEVVTSLEWSYDHLSDKPDVQLCFLYCCFFPEDSIISLVDLRNYGIAEKFVKETRTLETASNELLCRVKILKDCGLLLAGDKNESIKMHDVVRDVAICIADRDHDGLVVNVDRGSGYLLQSEKLEICKRISLIYNEDVVLSHPLECPQLKSLMVAGTDNLPQECNNLFKESTTLSVLDIRARSQYDYYIRTDPIMRIPESVSYLRNIQTLYLHGCDIFNKASMLGGLTKLEVLSMPRCRIGELPEEIGNLTSLRYLDLTSSWIDYVEPNVFSKMTRIEELYLHDAFSKWGQNTEDGTKTNARFKEVATLPHLSILEVGTFEAEGSEGTPEWLKNVKQFRIYVNTYEWQWDTYVNAVIIERENMQKHLWVGKLFKNSKRNSSLVLYNCHGFKSVTELGAEDIEDLQIMWCNDLEKVREANESRDLFWTLRKLKLSGLKNMEKIFDGLPWSVKFLGQLRSIELYGCPRLSIIFPCNILFPEKRLENLQTVTVENCEAVQHVFSTEGDETALVERPEIECTNSTPARTSLLSGITNIYLSRLPKLKSIWNGFVPSGSLQGLTGLYVYDCHSLQYLMSSDPALSIIKPIKEAAETSFLPRPPTPPTFESLHCLRIYSCYKLKLLFSFGVARHLNQLHELSIVRCPGLRQIVGNGEEEPKEMEHNSLLPALQNLKLEELWRLTSFFKGDLPITCPLKEITVKFCPNLTRFPLKTISSQTSFDAEDSWFRRLQEQDENQTSVFERFVKQDEPELDTVHLVTAGLWSDDSVSRHEGMTQIWKILSEPELHRGVRQVIVLAVVLRSIELLSGEDFPQLQSEAAWMFSNVAPSGYPIDVMFAKVAPERPYVEAYGSWVVPILVKLRDSPHEDVREKVALALGKIRTPWSSNEDTIDDWVVPIIVKLLSSHQEDIRAQAVLALGTTVGVSVECRDLALGHGGLTALLAQLNGPVEVSILRNTTWALCQFFHIKPYLPFEQMKLALPALKSLVHSTDETICSNACKAISVIAADTTAGIQAVIETDVCHRLVELLQHPSPSVVIAALETIRNIALGDNMQIQCIIDRQVFPCLLNLLTYDHTENIKVAACWTIANIMHESVEHRETVIGASIIGPLVHQLDIGGEKIKLAAITTIRNATRSPTEEVIKHLVNQGCLKPLCDLLVSKELYWDSITIKTCLEGLQNILQVWETSDTGVVIRYVQLVHDSGGLKKIVDLICHSDTQVQNLAIRTTGLVARLSHECRDRVLGLGALIPLLCKLKDHAEVSILRSSLLALLDFFFIEPHPFKEMEPALPDIKRLIRSNDEVVCSSACLFLVHFSQGMERINVLSEAGVCAQLVELLQHPSPSVVLAASRTIQNIACRDDVQKQFLVDHQVRPGLIHILNHDHVNSIKVAACGSISDIMHNSAECTQAVIEANIIRPLVLQLETAEFNIKTSAVTAITSASECLGQQGIKHLVNQGCIQPLCDITCFLKRHDNILQAGETSDIIDLEGVNSYARLNAESGGLKKIVNLQCHSDTDIQEKAAYILKTIASGISSDSSPPHGDAPMGLLKELEGGGENILGHDDNETQVEAPVAAFAVAFVDSGSALSSSTLHGKAPLRLVEDPEEEGGNRLGHDNTETQVKVKHDLNSNVGKNDPSKGMDESTSISPNLAAKSLDGNDDDIWEYNSKDQTHAQGKDSAGLKLPRTVNVHAKASSTKQESKSAPTITETLKILDAVDIKIVRRTYFLAMKFLQEEGWRESFMYMSDERRKDWLLSIEAGEI